MTEYDDGYEEGVPTVDIYFAICKSCGTSFTISLGRPGTVENCATCGGPFHPVTDKRTKTPLIWLDAQLHDELELNFERFERGRVEGEVI